VYLRPCEQIKAKKILTSKGNNTKEGKGTDGMGRQYKPQVEADDKEDRTGNGIEEER
jgi:hypothetical protein